MNFLRVINPCVLLSHHHRIPYRTLAVEIPQMCLENAKLPSERWHVAQTSDHSSAVRTRGCPFRCRQPPWRGQCETTAQYVKNGKNRPGIQSFHKQEPITVNSWIKRTDCICRLLSHTRSIFKRSQIGLITSDNRPLLPLSSYRAGSAPRGVTHPVGWRHAVPARVSGSRVHFTPSIPHVLKHVALKITQEDIPK